MDEHRFDDFTRTLAETRSRRSTFRFLAGGAFGVLRVVAAEAGPAAAAERCPRGRERCGGRCRATCPDIKLRNPRTCACECPSGMTDCGRTCVGGDRCCPGEKSCGGGCIHEDNCCPYTEKECGNGSCLPKDGGVCCPDVEVPCGTAEGGCCNAFAGEECSDDGCCNVLVGQAVCGGKCIDTDSDPNNCGGCGVKCGSCKTCQNGVCRGPNTSPPACESCSGGRIVSGVSCGNHCCAPGAECCGGGCCEAGKCKSVNGKTCCLIVIDNRQYCRVQ